MTLEPGEHIWWHYQSTGWRPGMPHWLDPMTVVRDDEQSLVAWLPPGTAVLKTVLDTGEDVRTAGLLERYSRKFSIAKTLWRGEGCLRIAPVGAPWSVWLFWEPGWQFAGWYINLEIPLRREGHHIYVEDQVLDVWVTPDHVCHRKDEDELAAAVSVGRYSPQEASLITRKADLAEKAVAAWPSPSWDLDLTPAHDPQPSSMQTVDPADGVTVPTA
jgi:hypothetical protein